MNPVDCIDLPQFAASTIVSVVLTPVDLIDARHFECRPAPRAVTREIPSESAEE